LANGVIRKALIMSLIPMSPIWALLHLGIKYPPVAAVAVIGYFGYPIILDELNRPTVVVREAQDLTGKSMVALTFDDGWESVHSMALPELESRGMIATNYLTTGFFGHDQYIREDQVQSFVAAGWEIGAHTIDHPDLTSLTRDEVIDNMAIPLDVLSDYAPVTAFSSPYGLYNDEIVDLAGDYYSTHVNALGGAGGDPAWGLNSPDSFNPMNINRLDTNDFEVWQICETIMGLQDEMYVLIFHKLGDGPSKDYSINFNEFRQILACIESSGSAVVTITEGTAELEKRKPLLEMAEE
jgi:peptidoglycan/xylan/chitin deacetylase (PgdA/CDA1 family)